jgi:hypothetical protein
MDYCDTIDREIAARKAGTLDNIAAPFVTFGEWIRRKTKSTVVRYWPGDYWQKHELTASCMDIAGIECQSGQKKARVNYLPDRSIIDYAQLFTATSMMPSHVIGDTLGLDVTATLQSGDPAGVARIAEAWNTIWDLTGDIDLKRFPSAGPYKIDSVGPDGSVLLIANGRWWGTKPVTKRVTVWPRGVDVQDRINNGTFHVVDVSTGSSGTLTTPDGYQRTEIPSGGIEQLIFAAAGPLSVPTARRAVALCTWPTVPGAAWSSPAACWAAWWRATRCADACRHKWMLGTWCRSGWWPASPRPVCATATTTRPGSAPTAGLR